MLLFGSSHYVNSENYDYDERDAICSNCGTVLGIQKKYRDISDNFSFESKDMNKWKYCPYCGEQLYSKE